VIKISDSAELGHYEVSVFSLWFGQLNLLPQFAGRFQASMRMGLLPMIFWAAVTFRDCKSATGVDAAADICFSYQMFVKYRQCVIDQ